MSKKMNKFSTTLCPESDAAFPTNLPSSHEPSPCPLESDRIQPPNNRSRPALLFCPAVEDPRVQTGAILLRWFD